MDLNLYAAINTTSYGYVGSYFLKHLRNKTNLKYYPITDISPDRIFNFERSDFNLDLIVHPEAPCLKVWHQHDLATFVGKGKRIGFPIFELDSFTDREISHLKSCDLILVCSKWAQEILANHNLESRVVPLGYNPDIFKPFENKSETFIFGNFGKWEIRKGHDILHTAFNLAFTQDDDVELWMMPSNFHLDEQKQRSWYSYYQSSKLGAKIKFAPRVQSQLDVYEVMKQVDCGVFPARAEGWNLEALECLACGKNVIATNYSGHTEFLNNNNAYLIDLTDRESAFDGVFFHGQGNWAKFKKSDLDNLVDIMREVFQKREKSNPEGPTSISHLTWENVTSKLVEIIDD